MAPWPNRIANGSFSWHGQRVSIDNGREHALHGLVADTPWQVVARAGRVVEMTCDFGTAWPWEGRAWQRIELGAGFLAMKMEVRSAREPFPAGCGWHPWFRRDVTGSSDVRVEAAQGAGAFVATLERASGRSPSMCFAGWHPMRR